MREGLTHVDESGAARMVEVSGKDVTAREAVATGRVLVSPEVVALLRSGDVPKGDALAVARVAWNECRNWKNWMLVRVAPEMFVTLNVWRNT